MGNLGRDVLKHSLIQILEYENENSPYDMEKEFKNLIESDFYKNLELSNDELIKLMEVQIEILRLENVNLDKFKDILKGV